MEPIKSPPAGSLQSSALVRKSTPATTLDHTTMSDVLTSTTSVGRSPRTAAMRRFARSFDRFVESINKRMQDIDRERLNVLYHESHGIPVRENHSLSVASGELSGALQRDVDAPGKLKRGDTPRRDALTPAEVADAEGPTGACEDLVSERSVEVSIAFPVLSTTSSPPNWSTRNKSNDLSALGTEPAAFGQIEDDASAAPLNPNANAAGTAEAVDELRSSPPVSRGEGTPAMVGIFKESGSSLSVGAANNSSHDRAGYERYAQFAQRILRDPTIDADKRNHWVDELVTTSLTLFKLSAQLYESVFPFREPAAGDGLLDTHDHMASVIPVTDTPTTTELIVADVPPSSGRQATRRSPVRARATAIASPLSVPADLVVPGSPVFFAIGASEPMDATQSVSFLRNRRESCTSYADASTASSMNSTAMEVLNHYYVMRRLGVGTTGTVRLCVDQKTRKPYAVKSMALPRKSNLHSRLRNFANTNDDIALMSISDAPPPKVPKAPEVPEVSRQEREIRIMRRLRHCPNVVHLHEVIDDEDENMVHLIMTLAEGGPISEVRPFNLQTKCAPCSVVRPLSLVAHYGRQILEALLGLQQQRIIHNDIKPDNILLTASGGVELSDFGESVLMPPSLAVNPNASVSAYFPTNPSVALLSRRGGALEESHFNGLSGLMGFDPSFMPDSSMFLAPNVGRDGKITGRIAAGTPAFSAPELVENNMCSYASDVWSFGVLLYAVVFGRLPFAGQSIVETYRAILQDPLRFPERTELDADAALTEEEYEQWKGICQSILKRDPLLRPTARSLLKQPMFANATAPPPPTASHDSTSASALSQKILNAVLTSKESSASAGKFTSPEQFLASPHASGGAGAGFLAEVVGQPSASLLSQLSVLRVLTPKNAAIVGTPNSASVPHIPGVSSRQTTGSTAEGFSSAPPAPPSRAPVPTTGDTPGGTSNAPSLGDSMHSGLLDLAQAEASSEGKSPAESAQTTPTTSAPPNAPFVREQPTYLRMAGESRSRLGHPGDHGPIVSFLEDSNSLEGLYSTTGRRLLRSTATTAAYQDEDPFNSRFSSRAGGRSSLGSHTITAVPSSSRLTGTDEVAQKSSVGSRKTNLGHSASAMSDSLTRSEDAPPTPLASSERRQRELQTLPAVYKTHSGAGTSRTSLGVDGTNSITSFRDPTPCTSATSSSTIDTTSQSASTERVCAHSLHAHKSARRAPWVAVAEKGAARDASFRSVPLSSDGEMGSGRPQPPRRGRRHRALREPGASISESDMANFPVVHEVKPSESEGSQNLVSSRDPGRIMHVTFKESLTIQAIAGQLYPMHDAVLVPSTGAPMALAPDDNYDGSGTLPPQHGSGEDSSAKEAELGKKEAHGK